MWKAANSCYKSVKGRQNIVRNLEPNCCSSFTQELILMFVIMVSLSRHFTYTSTCRCSGCVAQCTSCLRRKHWANMCLLLATRHRICAISCHTPQNTCDFLPYATEDVRIACHTPKNVCDFLSHATEDVRNAGHTPQKMCDFLPHATEHVRLPATCHRKCAQYQGHTTEEVRIVSVLSHISSANNFTPCISEVLDTI